MNQSDKGRLIGHGVVTKWLPEDLERKLDLEQQLIGVGLEGAALEDEALRILKVYGIKPVGIAESYNTTTDLGRAIMLDALIGVGITAYSNALAALGVGDSSTTFAGSQTNLQGATVTTDRIRKSMDATYPSRAGNVMTWRATYATGEANFAWNEWAIFNAVADSAGTMLNRAVSSLGTKTGATAWQLTVSLTQT